MSTHGSRLELLIDVFNNRKQRAQALPTLLPTELIEAILKEFVEELEFLGDTPDGYQLLRAADRSALDAKKPINQQISGRERLVLAEQELPLPKDAQRPTQAIYLREIAEPVPGIDQRPGKVYRLHWLPAIIGRPDERRERNEWLAVDLSAHPMGVRVSRRHAQITEQNGQYFVELLSQNPIVIRDTQGRETPLGPNKYPLSHGDVIYFTGSQIALKFIVRNEEQAS